GDEMLLGFGELRLVGVVDLAEERGALRRARLLGILDVLVVRHERLRLVLDERDPVVREVAQRVGVGWTFLHAMLLEGRGETGRRTWRGGALRGGGGAGGPR